MYFGGLPRKVFVYHSRKNTSFTNDKYVKIGVTPVMLTRSREQSIRIFGAQWSEELTTGFQKYEHAMTLFLTQAFYDNLCYIFRNHLMIFLSYKWQVGTF